jgi:hypothetical protein
MHRRAKCPRRRIGGSRDGLSADFEVETYS